MISVSSIADPDSTSVFFNFAWKLTTFCKIANASSIIFSTKASLFSKFAWREIAHVITWGSVLVKSMTRLNIMAPETPSVSSITPIAAKFQR